MRDLEEFDIVFATEDNGDGNCKHCPEFTFPYELPKSCNIFQPMEQLGGYCIANFFYQDPEFISEELKKM